MRPFCSFSHCRMASVFFFYASSLLLLVLTAFSQAQKDILFIAIDDLRTQLGTYGDESVITPNINAFSSESMVFERAYCQVALCSPSRTSLLTGRRPDTNHVWSISDKEYWRDFTNATTLPQYFKENGYTSIGMGRKLEVRSLGRSELSVPGHGPASLMTARVVVEDCQRGVIPP